jgi:hypothetical protein
MSDVPSNLIPTRITQLPLAPVASEDSLMMIVYNGNNYQIRVGDLLSVAGVPTTTQVIAGTSLTGGGQLTGNVTLSVANGGITGNQLNTTGVTAGSYGDATNIPVFTVDANGRVTAASTIAATISGYVPVTRQVIAGSGLTGGGALNANVTLTADLSDSTPLAGLTTGSAGVATSMSRSDHKHPQVDLSSANEVENILGLSHGGTAKSIVPMAGAVVWSGADGLYVSAAGTAGQVLVSGGSSAPTWGSAIILSDQPANVVYAGPVSGVDAPSAFRALVNADLPASGVTANTYGSASLVPVITVNSKGVITSVSTASITATGTVTSVDMTVPTGLAISGNPITTSGTLALTFASGYSIPTTANQTNWTTAYTQTQQWNGGSTNLVSATGRTSLGGTTVGQSMFTLTNPSAITFPRFNADNTVSALDAADFRTAIGAGSGGGSVTTISVVSANGFAGTVADATTTPAITLTTSISGMLKGSASALVAATAGTDYSAGTSALATGILKSTTTTGALTIAVAADFPTLNQNTTGTAANLTSATTLPSGMTLVAPLLGTPASGTLTNCTADGTNAVGYKNIPQTGSDKTTAYTLVTGDVGKYVGVGTSGSIVVPTSTFANGDAISIFNNTTGNITITTSAPTAYIAGTNTVKTSITLVTRGIATILFVSATVCVVSGNVL